MDVGRHDQSLTLHQRREVQRLAAGPGADVPPALARVGVAGQGDGLRGQILDLQIAPLESRQVVDVGLGVELCRSRQFAVNPGLEAGRDQLVPRRLLVRSLSPDPERRGRLHSLEEFEVLHLRRAPARRERQVLAKPVGKEPPGVGRDNPAFVEPFPALTTSGPVRGAPVGEEALGVAADRLRPDLARRVDARRVEQPGQEQAGLGIVDVQGLDPASPAEEGEDRTADEPAIGRGEVATVLQGERDCSIRPPVLLEDRPLDVQRDVDRRARELLDRDDVGNRPGTWSGGGSLGLAEHRRVGLAWPADGRLRGGRSGTRLPLQGGAGASGRSFGWTHRIGDAGFRRFGKIRSEFG